MTDAVFTVRVVLDGDDDTRFAAYNFQYALEKLLEELTQARQIRGWDVEREP